MTITSAGIFLLLAGMSCATCQSDSSAGTENRGILTIMTDMKAVKVAVEIVKKPPQRAKGLMFRKHLGAYHGMLFVFDREERQSFWMKNTYISLDIIFIDNHKKIVGVVKRAAPLTETPRSVDAPSRYVLEVNGGFTEKHRLQMGQRVRWARSSPSKSNPSDSIEFPK